jgi:hypothetical protein
MAGEFQAAGDKLIEQLTQALRNGAEEIMRKSIVECPISDETTYDTRFRTIREQRVRFEYPKPEGDGLFGDNGTLRRSARVFAPVKTATEITVLMGYGFGEEVNPEGRIAANYAVIVHEDPTHKHLPPTKYKYLEDPANEWASHAEESLSADINLEGVNPYTPLGDEVLSGEDLGA